MSKSETIRKYPPVKRPSKYKPPQTPAGHDGEPPEFMAKRDLDGQGKREETSTHNINIDRVTNLYHHKRIEWRQHEAAERLQKDWQIAKIDPIASQVLVGANSGMPELPQDAKVAAMKRHATAIKALGKLWPIIERVVIDNVSVEKASAKWRIHPKFGMGALWSGLHILADHYGIG